jgi:hypothetical protein
MIATDAMVEAALDVLWDDGWRQEGDGFQVQRRRNMRAALTAALEVSGLNDVVIGRDRLRAFVETVADAPVAMVCGSMRASAREVLR